MLHLESKLCEHQDLVRDGRHPRRRQGREEWVRKSNIQKYYGSFLCDNLHDEGVYTRVDGEKRFMYEGSFYANDFEGYARSVMGNCTYFEGLFKANKRFGPGMLTYGDGCQDVGLWDGNSIVRLSQSVLPQWVPKLGISAVGRSKLLKYRYVVPICEEDDKDVVIAAIARTLDCDDGFLRSKLHNDKVRNRNSAFFNKASHDGEYYNDVNCYIEVALDEDDVLALQRMQLEEQLIEEGQTYGDDVHQEVMRNAFGALWSNFERFQQSSVDELELVKLKAVFLRMFSSENPRLEKPSHNNIPTRRIRVTELLAWNNQECIVNIMKHAFLHRNRENIVNFSVRKVLMGERGSFGDAGPYECACVAFLTHCSRGETKSACRLLCEFNLNPDVSDVAGNSGVIFAAARDRIGTIWRLTQLGANVDLVNDEGLTALNVCLLRYVALNRGVTNWESAFLCRRSQTKEASPNVALLNLISHSFFANITHCRSMFYKATNQLMLFDDLTATSDDDETKDLLSLCNLIGLKLPCAEVRNFQQTYLVPDISDDRYMLGTELVQPPKTKKPKEGKKGKAKPKKGKKEKAKPTKGKGKPKKENAKEEPELPLVDSLQEQLGVIKNTIVVLLNAGANVNFSEVPLPLVTLAIYAENCELLYLLLRAGADVNAKTAEGLSPLHVLACLPASPVLEDMCLLLLQRGADASERSGPQHWPQERDAIAADRDFPEGGKTPLHVIAMRLDFELDPQGYLIQCANILSTEATLKHRYLGHTALTLAMLRGNHNLVHALLQSGADPNEKLDEDMGNPMTVYILKRYNKMLPDVDDAKKVMNLLLAYNSNPLNEVGTCGNAVEFMMDEYYEPAPPKGKKEKKAKKKKKQKKADPVEEMKKCLLELSAGAILKHAQAKAVVGLLMAMRVDECDEDFYTSCAKLLTGEETVDVMQILINCGVLDLKDAFNYMLMTLVVDKVLQNVAGKKEKKKKTKEEPASAKDLMRALKPCVKKWNLRNSKLFELDSDEKKYVACYNCGLRTGLKLIPCTKCGLVYFCSEKCNKESDRNKNTRHRCKVSFYNSEYYRYRQCVIDGEVYNPCVHPELASTYDAAKQLRDDINYSLAKDMERVRTKFNELYPDFDSFFIPGVKLSLLNYDPYASAIRLSAVAHASIPDESRPRMMSINFAPDLRSESRKRPSIDTGRSITTNYSLTHSEEAIFRRKMYDPRGVDFSRHASLTGEVVIRANEISKSFVNLPLRDVAVATARTAKWPNKYQHLIERIAEMFPDFNLSALVLPFVCFVDGQLYYRFLDDCSVYCSTQNYSSL